MARQISDNGTDSTRAGRQRRSTLTQGKNGGTGAKRAGTRRPPDEASAKTPRQTKRALLIALLKRKGGTNVATLGKELGWQPHTVRAALTGLRKAGFGIERVATEGGGPSRYRVTVEPSAATAG